MDLRAVALDGVGPHVIYPNDENLWILPRAWSPDGAHIAAWFERTHKTWQIVLFVVAGGPPRVLKSAQRANFGGIVFSPDSRYVAYEEPQEPDSPNLDILLLATDGSGQEIRIVDHQADDHLLGWIPNTDRVLFTSDRRGPTDAWAIQVTDGKPRGPPVLVKEGIGKASSLGFTPAGAFYFFTYRRADDVYVATLDPATAKLQGQPLKVSLRFEGANGGPDFSPDGHYVSYVSTRGQRIDRGVLCIQSLETGLLREVHPDVHAFFPPRWRPTTESQALLAEGWEGGGKVLWLIDASTGRTTVLVRSAEHAGLRGAEWSSDGNAIYYERRGGQPKSNWVVRRDLATGQETTVLQGANDLAFAVSPDGQQLAFVEGSESSVAVKVTPAAGGEARELVHVTEPFWLGRQSLAWSRDSRFVLFAKWELNDNEIKSSALWRVPVGGGNPERLDLQMEMEWMSHPRVHPDGSRIAFTAGTDVHELWVMESFLPNKNVARK